MNRRRRVLTEKEIEARRKNAQKSTGPRTREGKRRVALNALRHGLGASIRSDTMAALGERPEEFLRLLKDLVDAHRPTNASQRLIVQDIAVLRWQRKRCQQLYEGKVLLNLEALEFDRTKRLLEIGKDSYRTRRSQVRQVGLLRMENSPARYQELMDELEVLVEAVKARDFAHDFEPFIKGIYGDDPTFRGTQIATLLRQFSSAARQAARHKPDATDRAHLNASPEAADAIGQAGPEGSMPQSHGEPDVPESVATLAPAGAEAFQAESDEQSLEELQYQELLLALLEESRDVAEDYRLYMREQVDITPAMRDACLAPEARDWQLIIRQQASIDRQIERKIRLLMQMQKMDVRSSSKSPRGVQGRRGRVKKDCFLRKQS